MKGETACARPSDSRAICSRSCTKRLTRRSAFRRMHGCVRSVQSAQHVHETRAARAARSTRFAMRGIRKSFRWQRARAVWRARVRTRMSYAADVVVRGAASVARVSAFSRSCAARMSDGATFVASSSSARPISRATSAREELGRRGAGHEAGDGHPTVSGLPAERERERFDEGLRAVVSGRHARHAMGNRPGTVEAEIAYTLRSQAEAARSRLLFAGDATPATQPCVPTRGACPATRGAKACAGAMQVLPDASFSPCGYLLSNVWGSHAGGRWRRRTIRGTLRHAWAPTRPDGSGCEHRAAGRSTPWRR